MYLCITKYSSNKSQKYGIMVFKEVYLKIPKIKFEIIEEEK